MYSTLLVECSHTQTIILWDYFGPILGFDSGLERMIIFLSQFSFSLEKTTKTWWFDMLGSTVSNMFLTSLQHVLYNAVSHIFYLNETNLKCSWTVLWRKGRKICKLCRIFSWLDCFQNDCFALKSVIKALSRNKAENEDVALTMRMRLGSSYLMLTVDPSGRTSTTGYSLSYLCRPQRTTDVLLELSWGTWVWSSEACPNRDGWPARVSVGQIHLSVHTQDIGYS